MANGRFYPGFHVEAKGDEPALIMAGSGDSVSFAELDATANRLARTFRALGLEQQDHVAVCMENRIELPQIAWGAHYAGLYYTFVSTRLTPGEVAYIVQDSGARVVVLSDTMAATLLDELRVLAPDATYVCVGQPVQDTDDLFDLASGHSGDPIPEAVEGSDMLYSSGTTGRPKGVKRPFGGQPLGSSASVGILGELLLGMGPDTVYLSPAPMYHAAPLRWTQDAVAIGATGVIMEHFDAEGVLAAIQRHKVTHAQFVPTHFIRMLRLPDEVKGRYDLSSLQAAIHAAAPCPPPIKRAMLDWWGPVVYEYYAGTEGTGFCWCGPQDWLDHPGTVGRALVGQVHVVDESGAEVPVGQEGLIYFGGGAGSFEYHNDPEKTASAHSPEGWSTLGDIGRLDADGFLYLTDRQSNMIITGGVNVYPQEAENLLAVHPAVGDVAVIGVPDREFGEAVKAVVVPADSGPGSEALAAELIAHCRANLADVKCPRTVDFRAELPRQPNGKLLKRLLRDEFWANETTRI
jgi:long-chain acyl-CoA synthetase